MATCRDIEPLITAVVDDEATTADRAAVSDHLRECPRCRHRASGQRTVRRILRDRGEAFHVEAPAVLRARCQPPPPSAPWFRALVRPMPVWATVSVVVVVFAAVFYMAGRGSTAFAAELVLDHVKCFALFERASGPGDPATIGGRMKAAYGWDVAVPASSRTLGLRLVGGRRCFSTDGRVAHILYRHAGRPLSLFIVPSTSRAAQQLAVMGHEAVIWSRGATTYVVLAREPGDEVARVAAYMRSVVE
jgi:anti-sigma factor RsiW